MRVAQSRMIRSILNTWLRDKVNIAQLRMIAKIRDLGWVIKKLRSHIQGHLVNKATINAVSKLKSGPHQKTKERDGAYQYRGMLLKVCPGTLQTLIQHWKKFFSSINRINDQSRWIRIIERLNSTSQDRGNYLGSNRYDRIKPINRAKEYFFFNLPNFPA